MTKINIQTAKETPLITILGPTASGKTSLGVWLANQVDGEIISADSRQVYRGMDIGTGKDLDEYGDTPYHLIDIADAGQEYNLFEFVTDFNRAYENIISRHKQPVMVGGTGMYLDAVLNRYVMVKSEVQDSLNTLSDEALLEQLVRLKPNQHNSTDLKDRNRLIKALEIAMSEEQGNATLQAARFSPLTIGLQFPRDITRQRITARLKDRLENGMIEEIETLSKNGLAWDQIEFYGLEYRYIAQYLQGKLTRNDMFQKLNSAIHQFAKQQEKWFRNIAKKGHEIHWLDTDQDIPTQAIELVKRFLE